MAALAAFYSSVLTAAEVAAAAAATQAHHTVSLPRRTVLTSVMRRVTAVQTVQWAFHSGGDGVPRPTALHTRAPARQDNALHGCRVLLALTVDFSTVYQLAKPAQLGEARLPQGTSLATIALNQQSWARRARPGGQRRICAANYGYWQAYVQIVH